MNNDLETRRGKERCPKRMQMFEFKHIKFSQNEKLGNIELEAELCYRTKLLLTKEVSEEARGKAKDQLCYILWNKIYGNLRQAVSEARTVVLKAPGPITYEEIKKQVESFEKILKLLELPHRLEGNE